MDLILAVTTFNRKSFLSTTIESWHKTANFSHNWTVLVSDDGSSDGSCEYLNEALRSINHKVIHNQRRGVHCGVNKLLKMCSKTKFDVCFKIDDDIQFIKRGWDDLYLRAIQETGCQHLVHQDPKWGKILPLKKKAMLLTDETGLLQHRIDIKDMQGAFYTITPDILLNVGFFDTKNFGPCGFGHVDYTLRCCKAGYNSAENVYDAAFSTSYVTLNTENYSPAPGNEMRKKFWNAEERMAKKKMHLRDKRVFVDYNEPILNVNAKPVLTFLTAGDEGVSRFIFHSIKTLKRLDYVYQIYDLGNLRVGEKYSPDMPITSKCRHKPKMIYDFLCDTPCEYVIYIDADVQVIKRIDEIIYSDFDVGITVRKVEEEQCAISWSWINAGVLFFRNNPRTLQFIKKWDEKTQVVGDDQLALSELVNPNNTFMHPNKTHSMYGVKIRTFSTVVYNHYYEPFDTKVAKCLHYCRCSDKQRCTLFPVAKKQTTFL